MAKTQLTGYQIKDGSVDLAVDVKGVLPSANGGKHQYILLQQVKSSGAGEVSWSAGTWRVAGINTIHTDETGSVSLTSNRFSLSAGTYEIVVTYPVIMSEGMHRLALYNYTTSSYIAYGQSDWIRSAITSILRHRFTITSTQYFQIMSRGNAAYIVERPTSFGVSEIFTQVELRKTA